MNLTSASSFRRMACGLLLLIGPALILVGGILDPASGEGGDTTDYLRAIGDDPDMAQVSTALWIWGFALTAIGIIGAVHVIRRRGVVLANIGGAFALIGMIMFIALFSTTIHELNNVEHLGVETAEKLSEDLEDYWVAFAVLIPALLGTLIGFILLGIAIIRSGVAHVAAGAMIIVGILLVAASDGGTSALGILANALLLGGWGMVGLKLLGMTDEQWEGREPLAAGPEAPQVGGPPPSAGPPAAGPPPAV
jgi:hypothetical protein